jgi:PAS domain S-box-containing protein
VGASTIAREITDRKRAEEELRATKEQLQVVTDNMAAAVTRCSRDLRYEWVSRGYAAWLGRPPEEIAGRSIVDVIGMEGFETIRPYMEEALAGRKVEYTSQVNFIGPGKRWIHVVYVPTWARGEVDGWIAVVTDLTDMLQAQLQLREANSKLARANEDLERFAFAASHDLQEPLRLINTLAQLLARKLDGALDRDSASLVESIAEAASRMRDLLSDLLVYSEVTEQAQAPETVDLNLVIDSVQKNLKAAIEENAAVISAEHLPIVSAKRGHLISLFQNLIGNSIKYRANESPRIRISVQESDGHYRFAVADNGIGIEPEYHEKIFGVFTRLHGKKIPGTGIGLAICQRVVERNGGRIWVESEPGRGATFAFTLPKPVRLQEAG